jgi:hypothetical protein
MPGRPTQYRYLSKPRLVPLEDYDDGSSSSTSFPVKSQQHGCTSRERCASVGEGFDLVENVLTRIFGCYRPEQATSTEEPTTALASSIDTRATKAENRRLERQRRRKPAGEIPRPPEIRRLSLQEPDFSDLERSKSLNFLFTKKTKLSIEKRTAMLD